MAQEKSRTATDAAMEAFAVQKLEFSIPDMSFCLTPVIPKTPYFTSPATTSASNSLKRPVWKTTLSDYKYL